MKPVVTIVGRPNVGKSTLFNRLVGERRALVDDMPGVTRDRHYAEAAWCGRSFVIVDTGGYDPEAEDDLLALMREQAQVAIEHADVILFLLDGKEGLTGTDELIADELRRARAPVFTVVNKLETGRRISEAFDFYRLGAEELHFISAEHADGVLDLMEKVVAAFPPDEEGDADALPSAEIAVAVVGRPNVGKSTLVNRMLGEERLLASDMPGTTRDSIDTVLETGDRRYRLIDTAGIRRKRGIKRKLEAVSVIKAFQSIDRADVVIVLFDATEPFVDQEARIAGLVHDKGRACILAVNKWDLVAKDTDTVNRFTRDLREHLKFLPYAPILFLSAKTGLRTQRILPLVDRVVANHRQRIATAQLNRFLQDALHRHDLPATRSKRAKIFYLSQVATRPPTFVGMANHPEAIHFSYHRYLVNGLRETFDFEGTPIRLLFKARVRRKGARPDADGRKGLPEELLEGLPVDAEGEAPAGDGEIFEGDDFEGDDFEGEIFEGGDDVDGESFEGGRLDGDLFVVDEE